MKRDEKGRFTKDENDSKGCKFNLTFPSLTTLIYWIFIGVVILPWAIILERCNALKKLQICSIVYLLLKMILRYQKRKAYSIKYF